MTQSLHTYFKGIAVKRISEVEIKPKKSNQHEFNGTKPFKDLLGLNRRIFQTKFLYLTDDEERNKFDESSVTWYDSRENHESRTEHRLYYKTLSLFESVNAGDLMIFCEISKSSALIIFAESDSNIEKQLLWLFGLEEVTGKFIVKDFSKTKIEVGFARNYVLEAIGIEVKYDESNYLDQILRRFGNKFPTTKDFSSFARSTITGISPLEDPDKVLLMWMQQEEILFKILEKHLLEEKLKKGFGNSGRDVDDFIRFSLSIHQRRKSRAGWAFDHHVAEVFDAFKIKYSRQAKTEGKSKPDFLFPGTKQYKLKEYPSELLTMLGIKTTAKDRWRQVLAEADKIKTKHLLTLEPAISIDQTNEMRNKSVQLVVPTEVLSSYNKKQKTEIINFSDFIKVVKRKQEKNDRMAF